MISSSALDLIRTLLEEELKTYTTSKNTNNKSSAPNLIPSKPPLEYIEAWVNAMERGLITGRPFSNHTIEMYQYFSAHYLKFYPTITYAGLKEVLLAVPVHQYWKRFKIYKSVVCLSKYLIQEKALDGSILDELKPLYPKRHLPPKRLTVDETQLSQVLQAATSPFSQMMVVLLAGTGLRVSEAVALRRKDVDFEAQSLTVWLGKGNKTRRVGLTLSVIGVMKAYLKTIRSEWVFSNDLGEQLTRSGLYHRLRYLGKKAGVKASPHALRRAFVTLNANKGRPLQMLQKACGHSDIKTTMSYCMTSEQEVIEAMKGW